MKTFKERLRYLRESKKITQKELARSLKVAESTISMYERGEREPSFELVVRLANFFNVSTDYLLGRTNDPLPPEEKTSISKSNTLPPLTPKDERDIGRDLERILNNLESDEALAFHGEPIDEETKELLRISLENSMRLAKQIAKQKFTPKKYRK